LKWFKLDFGRVPPGRTCRATVEGLKALKETPAALVDPVVRVGRGRLRVRGTVRTDEILRYEGGATATLFDRNWNRIADLPVEAENYVMPTGYHKVAVAGDGGGPSPWMFVRFITEDDDPIVVAK
jgi:hypothetical protein